MALATLCGALAHTPDFASPGWRCEVLAHWPRAEWANAACAVDSESGWRTRVRGIVDQRDRGLWQINSRWHPSVTDDMAFNWREATSYARNLWAWAGWTPWKGYALRCV